MRNKRNKAGNRILATVLFAAVMAAGLPQGVYGQEGLSAAQTEARAELPPDREEEFLPGLLPVPGENEIESTDLLPEDGVCASAVGAQAEEDLAARPWREDTDEDLPARYITEKLPDLRKQFYATCWSFSCMALAEINLMKKGLMDQADLSELHTVWFSYHSVADPLGGTDGDLNGVPEHTDIMKVGGNPVLAQNVLAGWTGAAEEAILKSGDADGVKSGELIPEDSLAYQDQAHLANFYEVNLKENPEDAKRLIRDHGAIAVSYYSASGTSAATSSNTFNSATGAFYDTSSHGGGQNHAVVIVGWDDEFSTDNFLVKPPRDGAWLVRNSWMEGSSKEGIENPAYAGYFWMSYANPSLAAGARAFDMELADNYMHNYQYDGAMYRTGWNPGGNAKDELKAANVFTAKAGEKGEWLEAVSFQTPTTNLNYKVEIYGDLADPADPESGTRLRGAAVSGSTKYAGYITVPLGEKVPLFPGERYAVVVTLKKAGGYPEFSREKDWSDWAITEASIGWGESFYYEDGWRDLFDEPDEMGNLVIKAFTNDIAEGTVPAPDPVKEADAGSQAALAEDLGLIGEEEDGTLSDAQLREILSMLSREEKGSETVSGAEESGSGEHFLWVGGLGDRDRAYVYRGSAVTPSVHVYEGLKLLKEKKDYTIRFTNNKNAGEASLVLHFKGSRGKEKKILPFTIAEAALNTDIIADEIVLNPKKKNAVQKPLPALRYADTGAPVKLRAADFDWVYAPAEDPEQILPGVSSPGRYLLRITAKDKKVQNYQGELTVPILVTEEKIPLSRVQVKLEKSSFVYTGGEILPELTVSDKAYQYTLREGMDFRYEVKNNVEPGTAYVILTGTGSRYAGTKTLSFRITNGKRVENYPDSIRLDCERSVPYVKGGSLPSVTVWDGNRVLFEGKDYTISCSGNRKVTKNALLRVNFRGRYRGSLTRSFEVRQSMF